MAVRNKTNQETTHQDVTTDGQAVIHLSERDSILVVNALRYPQKATPTLQQAMRKYFDKV